jgi:hypothetical protein
VIFHPRFREIGVGVNLGTPTDRTRPARYA